MTVRGGRYELLRPIASGGMATVHLGRALGAGGFERLVAVKVMHAHLAEEPEFVAMFLDEARLAARIRHPNVVGTIDIQQDEQGLFLVMDYVDGPSLQRVLRALAKKQRNAPLDVALRIFVDALAGLHAAHELQGVDGEPLHLVHRDVSPQNILIGVDGIAQITDFGVARAESRLQTTRAGVVKGKVCYMAPEQIRSEPIDRRTDVYAAGALLWEILTGQRLIRGDNDGAMMERILRGGHATPREVSPSVPEAISDVCMRALAAAPDDRFPTAAAFAVAVEAAAGSEGVVLATPRVISAFLRDLGIERAEVPAGTLSSSSKSLDAPASSSRPRGQAVSAATAAPSVGQLPATTHSAVLTPSHEAKTLGTGTRLWVGAVALVLAVGVGWLLVTRGPLQLSWRDAHTPPPTAASAADGSSAPEPAASGVAAAQPPRPLPAPTMEETPRPPPRTSAALAASASAVPPSRPAPAPRNERRRPEASPTTFRPTDL